MEEIDEIRIEDRESDEVLISKTCKWLVSLYERNGYRTLPVNFVNKSAERRNIPPRILRQATIRLRMRRELQGTEVKRWFLALPSPTEKLIHPDSLGLPKKEEGCNLLIEMLSDGPRMARDIMTEAYRRNISIDALRKAKKIMHVRTERLQEGWRWFLTD